MAVIAQSIVHATAGMRRAERELEQLLDDVFGATPWVDFEVDRGTLDVYLYGEPPAGAADRLRAAGFTTVHLHDHDLGEFTRCSCRARDP